MKKPIRVLIVDDSQVVRKILTKILSEDPHIEVVGAAENPFVAQKMIREHRPDVLTLDVEMPMMDGIKFLKMLMRTNPLPVVMISTLTQRGSDIALEALSEGAVEVVGKPDGGSGIQEIAALIRSKVRIAGLVKPEKLRQIKQQKLEERVTSKVSELSSGSVKNFDFKSLILVGASTGGTEAITRLLQHFPRNIPGTLIVQHIPAMFSKSFAERLNDIMPFEVKEAEDGDRVTFNRVLIAPGNYHMVLAKSRDLYSVKLVQSEPVWHQRPAVDMLFSTASRLIEVPCSAAILTGMGKDGAQGLAELRKMGAYTVAQDEKSSVVYGMPKAAVEIGAACEVKPLDEIADRLFYNLDPKNKHERRAYENKC